jgi:tRNA(Ile2) C34 agmatinyltransferase TiaS
MGLTPICPRCGSVAARAVGRRAMKCERCGHLAPRTSFTNGDERIDERSSTIEDLRRAGHYMPTRTIPLSDE